MYFFKVVILLMVFSGCDPQDGKLTLINNTNDTIFYSLSYGIDSIKNYPLTQLNGSDNYENTAMILALDSHMCASMDPWEDLINRSKDSTLSIFFFNKELIRTAGKDSIIKYQLYSKKERLKVKDLEKLNWKIIYKEE